jgi:hypothetical protein
LYSLYKNINIILFIPSDFYLKNCAPFLREGMFVRWF